MMFRHHDAVWREFPSLTAGALLVPAASLSRRWNTMFSRPGWPALRAPV
jgi:hypothetical protein